jgi:multimeric flavodoxin WrbA
MNILVHDRQDLDKVKLIKNNAEETIIISDNGNIIPCICCFGCWIKTPGQCVINDGYENMGELLSKCNQLIIISQCFYGCYSPFVKNVLDRSVCPYQLPYFIKKNKETRHPKRYKNNISLSIHFYGNVSGNEKETAGRFVNKMYFHKTDIIFHGSFDEIQGVL